MQLVHSARSPALDVITFPPGVLKISVKLVYFFVVGLPLTYAFRVETTYFQPGKSWLVSELKTSEAVKSWRWGGARGGLCGLFGLLAVVSLHLACRQVHCAQSFSDVVLG